MLLDDQDTIYRSLHCRKLGWWGIQMGGAREQRRVNEAESDIASESPIINFPAKLH